MSIKRTPNGRKVVKMRKEHLLLTVRQTTEVNDTKRLISAINAERTYNNRSKLTIARQEKAELDKKAAETRAAEIEKLIADEIQSGLADRIVASFGEFGIEETLKKFASDLKTFQQYGEEYLNLQKIIGKNRTYSFYEEFLYSLAIKYPKFILELPTNCFVMSNARLLPLYKLSLDELNLLDAKLKNSNVFDNPAFKKHYLRYFPNHVTEMHEVSDIAFALKLNPASFKKFKVGGSFRAGFYQNINILDTLVASAPEILKYLTEEELCLYADKLTSRVGTAINNCPSVLDNFPLDFFNKYDPKQIFASVNKSKLKPNIEPYFGKFPILATYFSSVHIKSTGPRPKKPDNSFVSDPLAY